MAGVAERVGELLAARGKPWPAPIEHFASLRSTSDLLKERAREGAGEWAVVLADEQTAGRGRHGRSWASPPGNLFLSVLLRPSFPPERTLLIPLAAGVAVAQAAAELGVDARLKWPNDVLVEGRKLAGILVEGMAGGEEETAVCVGVGVNLAMDPQRAPADIRSAVTSIRAETGRSVGVEAAAAAVLHRLAVCYDALARQGVGVVLDAWRQRSVPWWGRSVEVRSGDSVLRGVARGIDERGALLLEGEGGARIAVLSGEARELRLAKGR